MNRSNEKNDIVEVRRLTSTYVFVRSIAAVHILAGALFFCCPITTMADSAGAGAEAAKAEGVKRLLNGLQMYPAEFNRLNESFCTTFLDDFRKQRSIEYVEPIVHVDSYDDPALKPYRDRCPKLLMNKTARIEPRQLEGPPLEDRRGYLELLDRHGSAYTATKDFKILEVDIDNQPDNGKETLFYAEGYFNESKAQFLDGEGYHVLDLRNCDTLEGIRTHDPYDYVRYRPVEMYNGVIRYKDKHYIFDLEDFKTPEPGKNFSLRLSGYSNERRKLVPICGFTNVKVKKRLN